MHNDLLTSLQQNLASVEGVNMDEEMVNLMLYQNYFAANSKAIRTLDEMYDSLFALI
ncbi:flagellar hook-associated protein FlgK [compost metagenome]